MTNNVHILKTASSETPCVSCGACCAYFRVSFYWAEAESGGGVVPQHLTEQITPFMSCMHGTNQKQNTRCTALEGTIGECVSCSIYAQRPTPCREFEQSWQDGVYNEACDRARAAHGLPPLEPHQPQIAC
ncbi:YkgJ family cysteine cluster protein [Providencia rettgeri]